VKNVPEYVGYRTKKRLAGKKKTKKLWKFLVVVALLIAAFVILGAVVKVYPFDKAWKKTANGFSWLGKHAWPFKSSKKVVAADFLPEGKTTANYLIGVTKQENGATILTTCVLASYDGKSKTGSLIFFPTDLLVNTPGMGTDVMFNLVELDQGRITSTLVTVENILGTQVDRYVLASDRDVRIILSQLGEKFPVAGVTKITFKDPSLGVSVDLKAGKQDLAASVLASYMTYAPPGKELDLARRQEAFAPEALAIIGGTDIDKFVAKNGNLFDTDASNKELAGITKAFTSLKGKSLQVAIVPVKEFRFEKTVVHRVNQESLPAFIRSYLKSPSTVSSSKRVKIEVLNGCGVPGIGEKASSDIDLSKFQVVNSANADNFDHAETLIIIYSDDKNIMAAAQTLRNELEVGKIVSHPLTQDMADISIIVGKDYASK
jgi:anionic cell wall polymer biosynthesis LytR-Cps2A-Psr (LCP) family protein